MGVYFGVTDRLVVLYIQADGLSTTQGISAYAQNGFSEAYAAHSLRLYH